MRLLLLVFAAILLSFCGANKPDQHRVVFQMTSNVHEEQKGLINNLQNLQQSWGENAAMQVVLHGPGLSVVVENETSFSNEIKELIKKGVVFVACENTMLRKKVLKSDLVQGVKTVPMGIGEIVKKQEQGWTYIKANF